MKPYGKRTKFSKTSDYKRSFWSTPEARYLLLAFVIFITSAAVLLAVYFLCYRKSSVVSLPSSLALSEAEKTWKPQCPNESIPVEERFDCYPEDPSVSRSGCIVRGCCWVGSYKIERKYKQYAVPKCIYPMNYGYRLSGIPVAIYNGFDVPLNRLPSPSRYGDDIEEVHVLVEMQTPYRLRIKFYDPKSDRYEVPSPKIPMDPDKSLRKMNKRETALYSVTYTTKDDVPFAVKVRRTDNDITLFDTSVGGLTISDHLLEVSTLLPSSKIYGLEEHVRGQLHHDLMWRTWSLYADSFLQNNGNMPGVHPMYLCLENDGKAHGVLLLNSNAIEVVLQPLPALTFRSIGGILDFYLFLGPTPEDVIKQYTEAVGRPMMPPYWALGLHVGRNGYHSTADAQLFIDNFQKKHVPVEVLNLDARVLQQFAFNVEKFASLPNLSSYLHKRKQNFLLALQPGMSIIQPPTRDPAYNMGLQQKVFVTDKWGLQPMTGKKDDEEIVYPDFFRSSTLSWWADVLRRLSLDLKFDGLWMVDNEPSNDVNGTTNGCINDDLNWPPYLPNLNGKSLYSRTLCMDATQHWKDRLHKHYNLHNLYGHSMAMATANALDTFGVEKRKLLLSHSTFIGTGKYAGHWIEGIKESWEGMKSSIPAIMEFSFFGISFIGTNICGSEAKKQEAGGDEELCLRWIQLGMFYPFSRIYNSAVGKLCESGQFSKEFYRFARHAIELRYELLPYLYNLFYEAHINGHTVMRPLFHEFPTDNNTHAIYNQFMWGSALLIVPILEKVEDTTTYIKFYIPPGTWYDFYSYEKIQSIGMWMSISISLLNSRQPVILYLRSGSIIPLQQTSSTVTMSRKNPLKLVIALNSTFQATGSLFWDDGETKDSHLLGEYLWVDFLTSQNTLVVNGHLGKKGFLSDFHSAFIQQVTIMGLTNEPRRIIIDDSYTFSKKQYKWDAIYKVLHLKHILIPLARKTQVKWTF